MKTNWQSFWQNYRNIEAQSETDLFVQVGKTIASQPISNEVFQQMISRIAAHLELDKQDHLLDFCCGNGLVSFELAPMVKRVVGIDFAEHLIKAAVDFKSLSNIDYGIRDVTAPISELIRAATQKPDEIGDVPNKYLMNDALAYFNTETLGKILDNINFSCHGKSFRFLITGIPNSERKWNFYDTAERKRHHINKTSTGDDSNDGLGRWWQPTEITMACTQRDLKIHIENQPDSISNYRMDALIWQDQ